MANENTASFTAEFDDTVFNVALDVSERMFTSAGGRPHKTMQTVPITEAALNLGGITNVGLIALVNLDDTNFVNVLSGTGGDIIAVLQPDVNGDGKGGFMVMTQLGDDVQTPYLIADTDPCNVAVLVVEL